MQCLWLVEIKKINKSRHIWSTKDTSITSSLCYFLLNSHLVNVAVSLPLRAFAPSWVWAHTTRGSRPGNRKPGKVRPSLSPAGALMVQQTQLAIPSLLNKLAPRLNVAHQGQGWMECPDLSWWPSSKSPDSQVRGWKPRKRTVLWQQFICMSRGWDSPPGLIHPGLPLVLKSAFLCLESVNSKVKWSIMGSLGSWGQIFRYDWAQGLLRSSAAFYEISWDFSLMARTVPNSQWSWPSVRNIEIKRMLC